MFQGVEKGCIGNKLVNLVVASKTYHYIFVNVSLSIFYSRLEHLLIL